MIIPLVKDPQDLLQVQHLPGFIYSSSSNNNNNHANNDQLYPGTFMLHRTEFEHPELDLANGASKLLVDLSSPSYTLDKIFNALDLAVIRERVCLRILNLQLEKTSLSLLKELFNVSPQLVLQFKADKFTWMDFAANDAQGYIQLFALLDAIQLLDVEQRNLAVQLDLPGKPPSLLIKNLDDIGVDLILSSACLTLDASSSEKLSLAEGLVATMRSDRPDGLFPTMVVDTNGVALGLVYSNQESLAESLRTHSGVYWSRKRGLWHKGETSGDIQKLEYIQVDCDRDCLRFTVQQLGKGFCHLGTMSCFGSQKYNLLSLENTLKDRLTNAPEGSYTARLFKDEALLHSKLLEEAKELCDANTKEEVAFEAADLLYFTLVRCISKGVDLRNVNRSLAMKSLQVTRRKGDAKPIPTPITSNNAASTASTTTTTTAPAFQLTVYDKKELTSLDCLQKRPAIKNVENLVAPILNRVKKEGDAAVKDFTKKFDRVDLESVVMKAPFIVDTIEPEVREAIDAAYDNIKKFHQAQLSAPLSVETAPGVVCQRIARPIQRVGLYVPGGNAILPSTCLMLGIPAQVAGCETIVVACPPRSDGKCSPEVMYAAQKVGASYLVMAGGAQAIGAMAYGTESVPKVDKICGPGNQFVTTAKTMVQNDLDAMVSIDMPAGPSEVLVVCDSQSNPAYVAADLLSQAEHGPDSQVVLVGISLTEQNIECIQQELSQQAQKLPRAEIVKVSLSKSFLIKVDSVEEAVAFSNSYAPEHLILLCENPSTLVSLVTNAGSVFVGPYSPESCGDYASGTNHTLPTYGYARMYSGVNTQSFMKHITVQELTQEGLRNISNTVMNLARVEGLEAHRNAVAIRLKE